MHTYNSKQYKFVKKSPSPDIKDKKNTKYNR